MHLKGLFTPSSTGLTAGVQFMGTVGASFCVLVSSF